MLLLLSSLAVAAPPGSLDVAALTDFPLLVGGSVAWEHDARIRLEGTAGVLPGAYVDTINWGLTTFDVYSDTTAELIDVVLQNALVSHVQLGYRPFEARGLSVAVGYQHIGFAGDTTDVSLFSDAVLPDGVLEAARSETGELEVDLKANMVSGELGYQWLVKDRLVLRSTLGFAYTFKASTEVSATGSAKTPVGEEAIKLLNVAAADYLDFVFEEWVHLPMVGVSAGYRFF